jgi:GT2 family glycosyltransferase
MESDTFNRLTVVVCTRNRLDSLQLFFKSCKSLLENENVDIVIVDSSNPPLRLQDLEITSKKECDAFRVKVIHEMPGIPRARNFALKEVKTDLVTFVDDDISLPNNFSELIFEHFNNYPQTAGVGPRISGMYENFQITENDGLFSKMYKRRVSRSFGKLTAYGENFWFPGKSAPGLALCEWLPGCCMTYNFKVLEELIFNDSLENGPGKSYAVGEDVDFSTRASKFGPLYFIGSILIEHREEPGSRDNRILMAKARGSFRAYLTYEKRIHILPTLYHMSISFCASLLRVCIWKPYAPKKLKEDLLTLIFYLGELYSQKLKNQGVGRL